MLGALAISAIAAVLGKMLRVPLPASNAARSVIAGSAFTPGVVHAMTLWWPSIVVVLGYTLVSVVFGSIYF